MRVRRGDVVRVDIGGTDDADTRGSEIYKSRRSIVVQNDMGNTHSSTTIIAPISNDHTGYPFHVNLPGSIAELEMDSHVQLDQLRTVDISERITQKYGQLAESQMNDIDDAIRVSLGLV